MGPLMLLVLILGGLGVAQAGELPTLDYPPGGRALYAVPPAEQGLPTVVAEPWLKVSDEGLQLESPAFDRDGNLLFVEVFGGRVFRLTPERRLTELLGKGGLGSAGLAIHRDGRIFIAGLGNFVDTGSVLAMNADATAQRVVVPASRGYLVDDLVFDAAGGFYFSDFRGTSTEPGGGVYYVSPDGQVITPILPGLAIANGIALSPDGKILWVTEFATGLLHRIELADATTIAPFGEAVVYRFAGPSPDSMRVDADGNLYVAMYSQGRVLVLNPNGTPIGQILLPGREDGHFLRSTSLAIKPGTRELYITASDGDKGRGAVIFRAAGFARALPLYSHQ